MRKLYQEDSYLQVKEVPVNAVYAFDGRIEISCEELLFHPEGGGQPDDFGVAVINGQEYRVIEIRKHKGDFRVVLDTTVDLTQEIGFGDSIECRLDWGRRYRCMRLHTGAHVLMAATKRIVNGFVPRGMQMSKQLDLCQIAFDHPCEIGEKEVREIIALAGSFIHESLNVKTTIFSDISAASTAGGDLFRMDPSVQLKGKVRIVEIEGVDFNPCSGTHVANTSEVESFDRVELRKNAEGPSIIQFTIN